MAVIEKSYLSMEDFNGSCTQGILKKESVSAEMSKVINCAALLYIWRFYDSRIVPDWIVDCWGSVRFQ